MGRRPASYNRPEPQAAVLDPKVPALQAAPEVGLTVAEQLEAVNAELAALASDVEAERRRLAVANLQAQKAQLEEEKAREDLREKTRLELQQAVEEVAAVSSACERAWDAFWPQLLALVKDYLETVAPAYEARRQAQDSYDMLRRLVNEKVMERDGEMTRNPSREPHLFTGLLNLPETKDIRVPKPFFWQASEADWLRDVLAMTYRSVSQHPEIDGAAFVASLEREAAGPF